MWSLTSMASFPPMISTLWISLFFPKIFKKSPKGRRERFALKFDFQRLSCYVLSKFWGSRKITTLFLFSSGSQVFSGFVGASKPPQTKNFPFSINPKKANSYQAKV
jgi:hypothetical protein